MPLEGRLCDSPGEKNGNPGVISQSSLLKLQYLQEFTKAELATQDQECHFITVIGVYYTGMVQEGTIRKGTGPWTTLLCV